MKIRISTTIDRETNKILESLVEKNHYRNKSHAIEEIIKQAGEKNDKN